jgi:glycosyltransferase A (GT-A) superfamily protein (DUF2064 family)
MNKTAIILFANLPDFEARVKSFSGFSSKKATQRISSVLTQHFYNLAKQSTADSFLIDSYHQKGKSFGERISNAFADVYAKGYENVICIGNDCPELNLTQLQTAVEAVENGNVVLGPTQDGGSYLMGVPKCQFNYTNFLSVKWQSNKTYNGLKKIFNTYFLELSLEIDIDSAKHIKSNSVNNKLIKFLKHLIFSFKEQLSITFNFTIIEFFYVDRNSLKAPPLV